MPFRNTIEMKLLIPKIGSMKRIQLLAVGTLIVLAQPVQAQFRKYSNEFLNIGAGARGLAMGSAQVATVSDGQVNWNPAGLTNVKDHPQLNLMHAEYFAGIGKYDYGSLILPMKDNKLCFRSFPSSFCSR